MAFIPLNIALHNFHKKIRDIATAIPQFLPFQRPLDFLFLSFQIILLLIQNLSLFTKFFHTLQLRPHSLPAIRLYLLIFPGQIADCIIIFLSDVYLPFLFVLMPLTVPLSTAPVPCQNNALNAPNQPLSPVIDLCVTLFNDLLRLNHFLNLLL